MAPASQTHFRSPIPHVQSWSGLGICLQGSESAGRHTALTMCREPVRHSTRDKGHEEGGSAYAKAGSSLMSPPGYSRAFSPQKTRVGLLYCFVLSPLTLLGAVPYHHLSLSVKELTYSSN